MTAYYKDALPRGYELAEYTIEAVLGHGGFGVTYLARDRQLGTQVAIKEYLPHDIARRKGQTDVIASSAEDETVVTYRVGLREFLKEGQALARFKHENIVRVLRFLEANGTAYMVMEYEKGESLAQYLRHNGPRLDQAALLRIFLPIMNGLHAVHQAKLLHLDIKPENIYLREDGNPMLIDFGSARQALVGPGQNHAVALTPGYAPIEQYPSGGKQGPWTDVYAIGASLHRCICGKRPVASTERHQAILRYEPDPLPPALELGQGRYPNYILESIDWALRIHANERPRSARELQDALMGKNASKRVQAAPAVFNNGKTKTQAITPRVVPQARRPSARVARTRRRSPGRWFAAAFLLGGMGAGAVVYSSQIQTVLPTVMNYVRGLTGQQQKPGLNNGPSSNRSETSRAGNGSNDSETARREPERSPRPARTAPDQFDGPPRPAPTVAEPGLLLQGTPARTLAGHKDWVYAVAFSPDGKTLASGSYDRTIRLWNVATGANRVLRGHGRSINSVAYSPDGKWLASGGDDASVRLWDAIRGTVKHKLRGPDYAIYSVAFSPTSDRLAAAGKDRTVFVWDVHSGDLLYTLEGHTNDILAIAFAPDGGVLASAGADKGIKLWDLNSGRELATLLGHRDVVLALAFSRDGRWLASGGAKDMLKLWDPHNARLVRNFPDVDHSVLSLSFSPDSRWLAAGGAATGVDLWYTESASIAATLQGHDGYVHGVAFSPDGTTLASASRDHTIKIWTTR
jgi:WD40 repeat protein